MNHEAHFYETRDGQEMVADMAKRHFDQAVIVALAFEIFRNRTDEDVLRFLSNAEHLVGHNKGDSEMIDWACNDAWDEVEDLAEALFVLRAKDASADYMGNRSSPRSPSPWERALHGIDQNELLAKYKDRHRAFSVLESRAREKAMMDAIDKKQAESLVKT